MRKPLSAATLVLCLGAALATPGARRPPAFRGAMAMQAALDDEALAELPERIALTLHGARGDDLFIWNWRSGAFYPVSRTPFQEAHGTWSPDGEWLAFETGRHGPGEIYIVRPDCVRAGATCPDGLRNVSQDPGDDLYPTWSPDGRIIHFSDRSGSYDIWLTSIDGRPPINLTDAPTDDLHPNFSPRGDSFAMRSDRPDPEIWRFFVDTGETVNLTNTPGQDRYPNHSPDGTRLLFVSDRTGDEDVWIMNEDGSGQTNLTAHPTRDYHGSWSPDGRYILFVSDRKSRGDLYLMDEATGEIHLVLDLKRPIDWPFWEPLAKRERPANPPRGDIGTVGGRR